MPFCPHCGKYYETNFCPNCGADLRALIPQRNKTAPVQQKEKTVVVERRPSRGGAIAAIILLFIILGGIWLFFSQPYGSPGSPWQCLPHQEVVYVGYIQTMSERFQITEADRITHISYDKGLLLYTVYLTNDQGQRFEYHYVTEFSLSPITITTGCW
jgi:hypothetical protein